MYPYFEIDIEQDVIRKPLLIAELNSRVRTRSGTSVTIELKWNPDDTRRFGTHVTVVTYVRSRLHVTCSEFCIQALARFGGKSHGHPDFKERKNNNKAESFFRLNSDVYTNVDNGERARAIDKKRKRQISLE